MGKGINVKEFAATLEALLEKAELVGAVNDDPIDFFDGYDGCPGIPNYSFLGEEGVFVFLEEEVGWRFDPTSGQWHKNRDESDWTLRIDKDGILAELLPGDPEPVFEEWFSVQSPSEVVEIIKLLIGAAIGKRKYVPPKELPVEAIIEDVYVPFFRHPDELGLSDEVTTWASVKPLSELIHYHLDTPKPWLDGLKQELKEARRKKDAMNSPADGLVEALQFAADDSEEDRLAIKRKCLDAAARLKDKDVLAVTDEHRVLQTWLLYAHNTFSHWQELALPVRVKLTKLHHGPFFRQAVSPLEYRAIIDAALKPFLSEPDQKDQKDPITRLTPPALADQKRFAFESAVYDHRLRQLGDRIGSFKSSGARPPEGKEQLKRKRYRFHAVSKLLDQQPQEDAEMLRASHPLPFFFEIPLLRWERSEDKLRIHSSVACFQQLLKLSCLLGLEEVHALRNRLLDFQPMSDKHLSGMQGHPSLGHWADCLTYFADVAEQLPVWGPWLSHLNAEHRRIKDLIEARNRVAHPDFVLDPDFLANVEERFASFFTDIFGKLRICMDGTEILLPMQRKATRDEDHNITYEFECHDLKTPVEPFATVTKAMPEQQAREIMEGTIITTRGNHTVSLQNYFQVEEVKRGSNEIFVYDREFTEGTAQVIGITTGISRKAKLGEGIFVFG